MADLITDPPKKVRKKKKKKEASAIYIDASLPRSQRPLMGYDIEQWRGELRLPKFDAQHALGFRNANHYNKICREAVLPPSIEIIVRIYLEYPHAPSWDRYTLQDLFHVMYGKELAVFEGRKDYKAARVDLGNRFTQLFGRSSSRKYNWLKLRGDVGIDTQGDRGFGGAYADVDRILCLMKSVPDPRRVLEQIAFKVFALRGIDIDAMFPIPTLESPPKRRKTGRRAEPRLTPVKAAARKAATPKAKPAAEPKAPKARVRRTVKAADSAEAKPKAPRVRKAKAPAALPAETQAAAAVAEPAPTTTSEASSEAAT
jgi:hypothetical protein